MKKSISFIIVFSIVILSGCFNPLTKAATNSGFCAIGEVNTQSNAAVALFENGRIETILYDGDDPVQGEVYQYNKGSGFYYLNRAAFMPNYPDNLLTTKVYVFQSTPHIYLPEWGGYNIFLDRDDAAFFVRYSKTEWRVLTGKQVLKAQGQATTAYIRADFTNMEHIVFTAGLIGGKNAVTGEIIPATAEQTKVFDEKGLGWEGGDKSLIFDTGAAVCDINSDSCFDILDLILSRNLLVRKNSSGNKLDINNDGMEDIIDLLLIKTKLLNSLNGTVLIRNQQIYDKPFVSNITVTKGEYGADSSGNTDCSNVIQKAIDDCEEKGGGVVYLPKGKYLVKERIRIPSFVTLRGDYEDPDYSNEYGTIIFADPRDTENNPGVLFQISGSGGVKGITVYYPEQSLSNVIPYDYTFYISGGMLQSVEDCTVINGYRGIGACVYETSSQAHEMMTIENVKGTFLYRGASAYNQSDVGTWKNLCLSNRYWANANTNLGMTTPSRTAINSYSRSYGVGLELGDLEWTQFANIDVSDYKTGIQIVSGKRIEFAGTFFDLTVTNCDYGIKADAMDTRWGTLIANSNIGGSIYAIQNTSGGMIKMTNVFISGNTAGSISQSADNISNYTINTFSNPVYPAANLSYFIADKTGYEDVSAVLQAALNNVKMLYGSGILYLPPGKYKLNSPVTVPAGVELRGSGDIPQRGQSGWSFATGSILLADYGKNTGNPDTDTALITLNGENSGIRGIRIVFPENSYNSGIKPYPYAVRGRAAGVYAENICIVAGYNGIDFRNCDNHLIKKYISCCYNNDMAVGGKNGTVEGCLHNGTVIVRDGTPFITWPSESRIFDELFNPITRVSTKYILIENAENQKIYNSFAYGVKNFITSKSSINTLAVNIGADNIGSISPMLYIDSGSFTAINIMRYNGTSYQASGGASVKLYNRLTINNKTEPNIK